MPTAPRRRTTRAAAVVLSAIAHAGLLIALLLYRPVLIIPNEPAGPPEAIIPILLLPRTPPAAAGGAPQGGLRLHRRAPRFAPIPPPVAPVVTAGAPAPAAASLAPPTAQPSPTSSPAPGPTADLRAALRRGAVGCANRASLSRAERDLCDERFGKGVAADAYIPAPINSLKRAYYDAVAEAKKPDGQPVPQQPPGSLGMFDIDHRGMTGHGPGIGCRVPFGPGKKPKLPSHWLTLGPCYIAPPQGPLTVEADITPP